MLKLINVTKRFSKKEVIHPLNHSFTNGVYGLLGPNGAGKTTLINMLAAVSRPSSGQICYNDSDIFQENQAYYDDLGFLPQQDAIYPNMKAKDYLFYLAALKGISHNEAHHLISHLSEVFNLSGELEKRCGKYSGGMKRRLGLMQAMLNNPRILILDEPTSGLDPMERIRLRNLIADLSLERTVIFSTHIVPDVEQIANRIIFLKKGVIIADGDLNYYAGKIRGKVWETILPARELVGFQNIYRVVSSRSKEGGALIVRFLAGNPPPNAIAQVPSLEDAFVEAFPLSTGENKQ